MCVNGSLLYSTGSCLLDFLIGWRLEAFPAAFPASTDYVKRTPMLKIWSDAFWDFSTPPIPCLLYWIFPLSRGCPSSLLVVSPLSGKSTTYQDLSYPTSLVVFCLLVLVMKASAITLSLLDNWGNLLFSQWTPQFHLWPQILPAIQPKMCISPGG